MNSDIKWFLGFIAIFGIMAYLGWSARGGAPLQPVGSAVQYPSALLPSQDAPAAPAAPTGPTEEEKKKEEIRKAEEAAVKAQEELRRAEEMARFSHLRNALTISGVSRASGGATTGEYVIIRAVPGNVQPILITGLTLRSAATGLSVTIPKAWTLPFPGAAGDGDAVWLKPGATVYLTTGNSPSGLSFQLNSCTGYFTSSVAFTPSLPRECPSPLQEPLPAPPNHLSDDCLDYLATIPICTVPGALPLRLQNDSSCQTHLVNKINYNTCVTLHKNEPNFYRGEWRIFLNRTAPLWKERREVVELVDQNSKLISSYSY